MAVAAIGIVLTFVAIIVWAIVDARQAALHQAEQAANNISLALERDIERVLGALDLSVQAAIVGMELPSVSSMDSDVRQALLFDGAVSAGEFGGVIITDAQGHVLYGSAPLPDPRPDVADRDFFIYHRANADRQLHIGTPVHGNVSKDWVLPVSRRYNHRDGSFAGVVAAGIRVSFFRNLFDGMEIGEHGGAVLLTDDARVIAGRPFVAGDLGRTTRLLPADMLSDGRVNSVAESPTDGIRRLYSVRHLAKYPLVLAIAIDTGTVYAGWAQRVLAIAFLMALLISAGLVLCLRLWREFRRRTEAELIAQRAERERGTALARLNAVFEHTKDTMMVAAVTPEGRFIYEAVNPVWCAMTGVAASDAIGRMPQDCLPPSVSETVVRNWRDCVRRREAVRYAFTLGAEGARADWEALVVPVTGEDGAIHRLISSARDVTDRNAMQARLIQSQRMEAVGQVAAGVAHDFNNILQGIMSALEFVCAELPEGARAQGYAATALNSAERGALLTRHLLAAARKQMLSPQGIDLATYLGELGRILPRMLGPQVVLSIEVARGTPPLFVDPGELETALLNLAVNAAHAMPRGGTLSISARAEASADDRRRRLIRLVVSDTGSGMDAATLARAAEPFFTTKGANGSGLGLAQVKGFSEQSGGQFRIESRVGQGTRVELWLPCVADVAPEAAAASEPRLQGRILLVDDAPDVLSTTATFLASAGMQMLTADTGARALALIAGGANFDALITDHAMPGMNGVDLILAARQIQPGLPAVLITGYAELGSSVTLPDGVHLLMKPFRRAALVAAIAAVRAGSPQAADQGAIGR